MGPYLCLGQCRWARYWQVKNLTVGKDNGVLAPTAIFNYVMGKQIKKFSCGRVISALLPDIRRFYFRDGCAVVKLPNRLEVVI